MFLQNVVKMLSKTFLREKKGGEGKVMLDQEKAPWFLLVQYDLGMRIEFGQK